MLIEKAQGELVAPLEAFDSLPEDYEPLADGVFFDIPAGVIPAGCIRREWEDCGSTVDLKTYITRAPTIEKAFARFFRGLSETLSGADSFCLRSSPMLASFGPDARIIVRMATYRD